MNISSTEAAFDFLCKRMPSEWDIMQSEYVCMLMEFQDNNGDEAIRGLAGFYLFALKKYNYSEKATVAILQTFTHDLNGRNEKVNLPRSFGYAEIWDKEHEKYNHFI